MRLLVFPSDTDVIPKGSVAQLDAANRRVVLQAPTTTAAAAPPSARSGKKAAASTSERAPAATSTTTTVWPIVESQPFRGHYSLALPNAAAGPSTAIDHADVVERITLGSSTHGSIATGPRNASASTTASYAGPLNARLLSFVHADAPSMPLHYHQDEPSGVVATLKTPRDAIHWRMITHPLPNSGRFALADEHGAVSSSAIADSVPVYRVVALGWTPAMAAASSEDVATADFQSKKGKQMERQRQEFGRSNPHAAANPTAMDRTEQLQRLLERAKRSRDNVAREVEQKAESGTLTKEAIVLGHKSSKGARKGH